MRATAASLALAAAVSVTSAASPTFAAGATPVAVPGAAAPKPGANDFAMPPEMMEKLSPEQILSVLRERESTRRPNVLIAIAVFGTLGGMVLLAQIYATRRERIRNETLRAMVDKGTDIPPDLMELRSEVSRARLLGGNVLKERPLAGGCAVPDGRVPAPDRGRREPSQREDVSRAERQAHHAVSREPLLRAVRETWARLGALGEAAWFQHGGALLRPM